ncbi:3955_t:CDS:2 [Dentiscutata erythropus]|uniref:3955_t:CDS:1 n=1 Tax=Dentiscutata erythropus TaxID=1348616 RepID=A0A9N9N5Z8_9GLOM|nr:3955_t:CDS:2 [Dentiscutata erythropus]
MSGASNELDELINNIIDKEINKINNEGNKIIKKYEHNQFSNLIEISRGSFGNVFKATWENSTIVLKSITIDTSQIDSGIIGEIKNAINTNKIIPIETTTDAIKLFITEAFHEKWIERKIIEGKINEHNIDEFEDYKRINGGASSKVYRARFKSTKNICALKYIENNNHTNKELVNELDHMLTIESHENIIKFHASLPAKIRDGLREKSIDDTPHEYVTIYTRCWKSMQDDRPSIEEVAMAFEDFVVQDITKDDSIIIHDISGFEEHIKNSFENIKINIKLNAAAVGQDEMSLFVNNLYSTFSKLFNEGRSVSDMITKFISQNDKTNEEVFQWLLANNNRSKYTCLLGLFYRWNIGTTENNIATLVDAANKGDAIAQYFVGRCYAEGWSTDKDKRKAIEWYTKAADNECAVAEHMLGEYYYKLRKYTKAFDFLKRAVENGNFKALNTLGLCYQRGQGTDTNVVKAFKSFEEAALWGLPPSQYELGNCYEYGIGTEINWDQASYWYQKATGANPNYQIHLKRADIKNNSNHY